MGILPAELTATPSKRRPLSPRRVRTVLRIGQYWTGWAGDGVGWRVAQIHRHDGKVLLERPGFPRRYVTFADLGAGYELER